MSEILIPIVLLFFFILRIVIPAGLLLAIGTWLQKRFAY